MSMAAEQLPSCYSSATEQKESMSMYSSPSLTSGFLQRKRNLNQFVKIPIQELAFRSRFNFSNHRKKIEKYTKVRTKF
jgi:hypothetical protein